MMDNKALDDQELVVTQEDLDVFYEIVDSYRLNKVVDESQSVMSAFTYAMTSPLIWKIREIYKKNKQPIEKVPIVLGILGDGDSGKSTLIEHYLAPFMGNTGLVPQPSHFGDENQGRITNTLKFMAMHMHSANPTPLLIDEMKDVFFQGKHPIDLLKGWANTIEGIHPVILTASNTVDVSFKPEVTKRMYYVTVKSPLLSDDKKVTMRDDVIPRITSNMFKYVVRELNSRLSNLSKEDEKLLLRDYLSITRSIIRELLESGGKVFDDKVYEPYSYATTNAAEEWRGLLNEDSNGYITFDGADSNIARIGRNFFGNGGSYGKAHVLDMNNYFDKLPTNVRRERLSSCIVVFVDEFDKFIGQPKLRELQASRYGEVGLLKETVSQKDAQMMSLLENMNKQLAETSAQNKELREKLLVEDKKTSKKGLFSRLFGK